MTALRGGGGDDAEGGRREDDGSRELDRKSQVRWTCSQWMLKLSVWDGVVNMEHGEDYGNLVRKQISPN